ncbi:MAG: CDP-2,3-bis-(O-geranylgeranyl)-sn-glycerol synthase [Thaumarchaeota archaeon]|nr:CDP-2,3-bis-(O-geranylgeranyl)-sn-glycerol synthase [Nitrososphaerota archaeon]
MLENLLQALIFVLPAYVANGAPVIGVKLIGRATPIDRGAKAWDGRRFLGDGKTIEGLIVGIFSGAAAGLLILLCFPQFYRGVLEPLTLSVGAILGDIFGSFVKRRLGLRRGQPAPGLDQLGFLCFALAFSILAYGVPAWLDAVTLISLLLITALLHVGTNYLAYLLGLKREPY